MKSIDKKNLMIIGLFLLVILISFILINYNKNNVENSGEVEFEFFDYDYRDFSYEEDNEKIINSEWINESTLEINVSIILVCGCEKIKEVNYEIHGKELVLYYNAFIDSEYLCADCAFPKGVKFRINNINKKIYNIILKRI